MSAATDQARALMQEATANGIREDSLRGHVAALWQVVTLLCDELDARDVPGQFVPDDFATAQHAGAGDGNG